VQHGKFKRMMSGLGQNRRRRRLSGMAGLPPWAELPLLPEQVGNVPFPDFVRQWGGGGKAASSRQRARKVWRLGVLPPRCAAWTAPGGHPG